MINSWIFKSTLVLLTFILESILKPLKSDYPQSGQLGFQDPASDWMYAINDLHGSIIFYLLIIQSVVVWNQGSSIINKNYLSYLHHGNMIEQVWTLSPAIILWAIGLPSLKLLYVMDEIQDAEITVKAIGNQWFWSYEFSDYQNENGSAQIAFDSFMLNEDSQETGDLRNLAVDNYQVLPVGVSTRLIVSSNDVIHCYAVPSLAIKNDAIPGRLNATGFIINRPSTFYGQCSELCGVLHGFMPIGIKSVSIPSYLSFIEVNKN